MKWKKNSLLQFQELLEFFHEWKTTTTSRNFYIKCPLNFEKKKTKWDFKWISIDLIGIGVEYAFIVFVVLFTCVIDESHPIT